MSDARNELLERWLESPSLSEHPRERPKTAWSTLGEAFIADLFESWTAQGRKAIAEVIEKKPEIYLRLVASVGLKPEKPKASDFDDFGDAELAALIVAARTALNAGNDSGSGGDNEG